MDFNVESRKLQLENLEQFISAYKHKIHSVLKTLGWNVKDTLQESQFITCSLDPSHKVPQKAVDRHIKKCVLRKGGYDLRGEFLSEPQHGISSIHIDDHKKIEILSAAHKSIENFRSGWNGQDPDPKTCDRLTSTFSTDERLALYNYATNHTEGPSKLPEYDIFTLNRKKDNGKPLTHEEKLAIERDLKRRKIKYKSVHTSHKNHIEILREVIDGQMELYKQWLNDNNDLPISTEVDSEALKLKLENIRSTAVSRNSHVSSNSKEEKRQDRRAIEGTSKNRSTSRKTSVDRGSERSASWNRRERSRSRDNQRRYRGDRYDRHSSNHERDRRKNSSPQGNYRHDRDRSRSSREKQPSRDRRSNGCRENRH